MKNYLLFMSFLCTVHCVVGQWTQQGADINGEAVNNYSGSSVSLSNDGSRIAIGAYGNADNGVFSGHVRIYEFNGANWMQLGADINGEAADDRSGWSSSLSGDGSRVAIGAYWNDGGGNNSGHVRIYEFNGVNWVQLGTDINGAGAGGQSGWSVSISDNGSRVAIGAPQNSGGGAVSGHVRIYEFNGVNWVQLGTDIDGEAAGDWSGYSVSLDSNGNRVAIGAIYNDGGFGGGSGHVRIYEYNGANWVQLGNDIDSERPDDEFGSSVSISDNGNRVAIGAPQNDDNGTASGH
ncbi:MAG: hypothetical protein KDD04_10815, partial [Sinomicrobium sp.]|nr:hypothetical protein [Sinomicrobium sp.]